MDVKSLRVEVKDMDEAKGQVKAVFATFNKIDSDRDVTRPGAFTDGAEVPISAYGHTSWQGALPVGLATIRQDAKKATLEGQFFMDTQHGADAFRTVKNLGALGQWSYGYDPVEYSFGEHQGERVRFLDSVKVHEVSPVLLGAGVGTRTLSAKSGAPGARPVAGRPVAPHETAVVDHAWDGAKTVAGIAGDARPSELRSVFAWVSGDVEAKSSYAYAHHHGVNGPANVRACLAGIAALNGPKGASLQDRDRQAIHAHLAGHLRDADRDVPELRSDPGGSMKFVEEGHAVMAAVASYLDRATEVMALRRTKGKGMAPSSAEILDWIKADLGRLDALLSHPVGEEDPTREQLEAELASLQLRSLANRHGI
ncbi:HK97 family phage prohead protease [Actinomadura formosensis]|uniref:HK97 family phage prohead protease n=1 Tax=Actinomadura formosensis TaxID=60706 RepID=UPI003D8CD2CD